VIRLAPGIRQRLKAAAEATYPEEACGLLVGRDNADGSLLVDHIAESANVAEGDRRRTFEVDPKVRFDLMRALEEPQGETLGARLIGHYHSHPDHPPAPSATDLSMAYEPELVWLIVGVEGGQAGAVRGFRLNAAGDGFDEVEVAEASDGPGTG
jgi:[CysO sulfur-carrier protein]-S-L-cysteine hydrolase